jgi:hypothetical protein
MIHGPCGILNPKSVCMEDGKCTKDFPKAFTNETIMNENGYPSYARPDNGIHLKKINNNKETIIDNRFVVPYNPYLTLKYNAHINVELCSSVKSVKYLYKYVYKGYDSTNIEVTTDQNGQKINNVDECAQYFDLRYVSAPEAMWRIFEFKLHEQSHTIQRLAVHLENEQVVYFEKGNEKEALSRAQLNNSTLTAWFKLNSNDYSARDFLYHHIPNHYSFQEKKWSLRQSETNNTIGRMYLVNPVEGERYFLRLLLLHVTGKNKFN